MGGWMNGWVGGWMDGWMDKWMGGYGWMDGWVGGRMDGDGPPKAPVTVAILYIYPKSLFSLKRCRLC